MTNSAIDGIVGKRINGVIVKECPTPPRAQIFLMFDDRSFYEIWSSVEISSASGLDGGGREEAVSYMAGATSVVFEAWAEGADPRR